VEKQVTGGSYYALSLLTGPIDNLALQTKE
jgi:hypothetical protein